MFKESVVRRERQGQGDDTPPTTTTPTLRARDQLARRRTTTAAPLNKGLTLADQLPKHRTNPSLSILLARPPLS